MKVKELVALLLKENQELDVEFMGYEHNLYATHPDEPDAHHIQEVKHENASGISNECILLRGTGFWF